MTCRASSAGWPQATWLRARGRPGLRPWTPSARTRSATYWPAISGPSPTPWPRHWPVPSAHGRRQPDQHLLDQRLLTQRYTITVLVRILARCGHAAGIQAARDIIADATAPGAGEALVLAARAAATGLLTGAARHWREVIGQLSGTPSLLRAVLRDLADDMTTPFLPHLTDSRASRIVEPAEAVLALPGRRRLLDVGRGRHRPAGTALARRRPGTLS